MTVAPFLVDVSVWVRYPVPKVAERLDVLLDAGEVATCGLIELRLMSSIADAATYAKAAGLRRASVMMFETTDADLRRALEVQGLLTERGRFRFDFLLFDRDTALIHDYGTAEIGRQIGGWLTHEPDVIARLEQTIGSLRQRAVPLRQYLEMN